ncbi:MAG: DUF3341 domain-containing protein [Verrucomicrobia bacterium]|nr:MAG: DUF3341 domain-containing protein [Verrucomicrobiota bacterium]
MSASNEKPYGLLAEFDTPADIMAAAIRCRDAGFKKWDVHTPFPIHGMDDAMGLGKSPVGWFTFAGATTGFFTGMTMIWYMNQFDYPLVVGGKPLFTPLYAFPVSYELTILLGSFATLFAMLFLNRLPRLNHPLLKVARFKKATDDKFYLCIEAADPKYAAETTRTFLVEQCHATAVETVED